MHPFYTQTGFWLAVLAGLLMYVNAIRTLVDPVGFSHYMGLPIASPTDIAWVRVYGLRALFIGLMITYFLIRLDAGSLQWLAGFAVSMALGDALLVRNAGGKAVPRHVTIAAVLVAATIAIHHWSLASA